MHARRTKLSMYPVTLGLLAALVAIANAQSPPVPYGESNTFILNTNRIGFGNSSILVLSDAPLDDLSPPTALESPVPNPFNPHTTISFNVECEGPVELGIYDLRGRCLRQLVSQNLAPGLHTRIWDGRTDTGSVLPSGIYLVRLENGVGIHTEKLTLVR